VAEVGGTLIALSVPGLKPLFGLVYDRMKSTSESSARKMSKPDLERAGHGRKESEAPMLRRKSDWTSHGDVDDLKSAIKVDSPTRRGSSKASDDDLWSLRSMRVQSMEVAQISMLPRAALSSKCDR